MTVPTPEPTRLSVPDRFEGLQEEADTGILRSIIAPVPESLEDLSMRFADMAAARRGSMMILRGTTGSGKSTFLDTVHLFLKLVSTLRVGAADDIPSTLQALPESSDPRIVVLDGREALADFSAAAIETDMHAINNFVRSGRGRNTLVVWPTNTDEVTDLIARIGKTLGGEALFGIDSPITKFSGPPKNQFREIAEKTVSALNESASFVALGISEDYAESLTKEADTIGHYLALIRRTLLRNMGHVRGLMHAERYRVWVLVISGNDTEGDVAALTRGSHAAVDIDRAIGATQANIVEELKKNPDKVGLLGTVLDARIIHMDIFTALAVARVYGSPELHTAMKKQGLSISATARDKKRLEASELGIITSGGSLATRRRGRKPGGNTLTAFKGLAVIAQNDDGLLNQAIAQGLLETGIVDSFETERDLGTDLKFYSDIYAVQSGSPLRIEVMWRLETGRAAIANYTLLKLSNYGKAIKLLT
ncbi:hypothetical protein [Amycolatopsis japonica]|uniref:hypothetical protein n=1 Tax=Amycolatopsis japonica TaxID=208439 RepID=UPI0037F1EBF2